MEIIIYGFMKNILVIGGGTGTFTVLTGLKNYPVNLSAVVSMADDGGSTGILRRERGILPAGSIRPALAALLRFKKNTTALNFRLTEGVFAGHTVGNLLIYLLSRIYGDPQKALNETERILDVKGEVIPSTFGNARLFAKLENKNVIEGETNIDVPKHDGWLRIVDVWLSPYCPANPKALQAIAKADLIVIGPGDLFSSIIPNFLVDGIAKAVRKSPAKKVYVCNLMTKFGETNGFTAKDFVCAIEKYAGGKVLDAIILNTKKPSKNRIEQYEKQGAQFVSWKKLDFKEKNFKIIAGNFLSKSGFVRHDPDKLARVLLKIHL